MKKTNKTFKGLNKICDTYQQEKFEWGKHQKFGKKVIVQKEVESINYEVKSSTNPDYIYWALFDTYVVTVTATIKRKS